MRCLLSAVLVLMPIVAFADPAGIQMQNAWSRPMPAGATGVVYMTITDQGGPDVLKGVSSPVAASATLHESFDDHGVMKMRPVGSLPVAPDKPVTLAPGGYHVMLMGLKKRLRTGDSFPLTLTFEHAQPLTVQVKVATGGAAASTSSDMANMPGMSRMPATKP
jgi:periplasmic copper chaperone A